MLDPTTSRFWRAALQSGLMDADGLQACWNTIPPDKRVGEHIDRRLARQTVLSGSLTLWQAQQLMAGRSSGFKIDRYVLVDLIGQGGMGRVYLARDSRLNRRVAVKILSPERVNNPRAIARFHREAMVGAQLQHENLVRIYDEGEAQGRCYLVMEYIEGKNIGQMIAETGPIPVSIAARLTRQVALGLEHAQRKGLIHRDVNPYNILVTRDGVAKLTDLGLAIDLADESDRVTRDGATVGTFDYVSPEQARHSHNVDTRSDIYSLGCTLYHMLSGQVPFPSASLPEKLFGHQASEPQPLRKLALGVPEGLAVAVSRMMRKSPSDRYSTPLDVAQALEPYTDEAEDDPSTIVPGIGVSQAAVNQAASVTRVTTSPPVAIATPSSDPVPHPGTILPTPAPSTTPEPDPVLTSSRAPARTSASGGPVDLGLSLDFGPAPPLSKVGPSAKPAANATKTKAKPAKADWVVPVVAAVVMLAAAGALLLYRSGGMGSKPPGNAGKDKRLAAAESRSPRNGLGGQQAPLPEPKGKEVLVVDGDGEATIERDFSHAIRAAIGGRGHVLLVNTEPLKLTAGEAIDISGGRLEIRAGDGKRPVVQVEVKGKTPFLTTRSDTPLRLVGITVEVHVIDPGAAPAPAIEAGANVTLEGCAFNMIGESAAPIAGTSAVLVEGGSLTATGCWFANFDRPLDVACFGGSTATVRQCMFVSTTPEPGAGWAIRLRSMSGGFAKTGRRLVIEHCTLKGAGLLAFEGFSASDPMNVDMSACTVLADALIAWGPDVTAKVTPPTREALAWTGQGNLYDIRGKSWVALLGAGGAGPVTPMPDGPADLGAWVKLLGTEQNPIPPPAKFATDPASLPAHPTPADFAVTGQDASPPGADPGMVGPGTTAVKN